MKSLGVIPARYSSTRLEGKPLKDICGHTMIEWVYKRSLHSSLDNVIVATDDERIFNEVKKFSGNVIMTRKEHENGTSRVIEVCEQFKEYDIIVNIQGDEPLVEPEMIDQIINSFKIENINMCTLRHKINSKDEISNPHTVKVVVDKNDFALYFSRSVIPYSVNKNCDFYYKHVGIYGFKKDFLFQYSKMEPTFLEKNESLEQLRILENGYKIKVLETKFATLGVDNSEDLEKIIKLIKNNNIILY